MAARREAMADVFRQSRRIGEYGGTPAEEKGFLQKKLAGAKVQVDALAEGTRRAEDETVKLAGGWNSVIKVIPQWGQTVTIKQEAAKKMAESMNAVLADQRERVRAITAAIKDMPDQFPLFSKRANDQVRDLQTQLEMVGQTPGEAAATQARAQAKAAGLSGPGVDAKALEVRDATMDLERKQTLRSLEDQMRQLATDLEFDIQTIGKSAEEIAALRLEAFGKGGNNPNITGLIKANRNIAGLAQMRAEGLKAQGIKDDFKGFTDDLRLSIKGFGLSGDAMHALKLFTSDIYGALPQAKRDQLTGLLKLRQQQELSRVPLPSMGAFGGSGILAQQLSVSSQQGKMVVDELKAIQDILSGRLPKGISAEMAKVLKAQ
jgi:hypothetical protein